MDIIQTALLPVTMTAMGLGGAALFLYYMVGTQKKYRALLNKERLAAIEKGLQLPPEAFIDDEARKLLTKGSGNSLKTGIVTLSLGIGAVAALYIAGPKDIWAWGLILVLVGLGHLLYWFVAGRDEWERSRELEMLKAASGQMSTTPAADHPQIDKG